MFVGLIIWGVQMIGSAVSGSLALLADTSHVAIDLLALCFSAAASSLSLAYPHKEHSVRKAGGYVNALLLALVGFWIGYEAIRRAQHPGEIIGLPMILAAAIGGLGNYVQHSIISRGDSHETCAHTATHTGAKWHVLSDLWQSVAVVVTAAAIMITGKTVLDLIISGAISALMLYWAFRLGRMNFKGQTPAHHHH